ncbi:MAG: hypothetical protein HC882_00460 [Acidobacteria bacterium]|nr:hypothetical protein [Acidobacteriota bacterium]
MSLGYRTDLLERARGEADLPPRTVLETRREKDVVLGGWTKADVWLSRLDDGTRIVIKDFRRKNAMIRFWGRIQTRREARILELLSGLSIVPKFLGRVDAEALALEYVPGHLLHRIGRGPAVSKYLQQLRRAMDSFHRRGIIHNDLRGRENVLVRDSDDHVIIVDWAGAVYVDPRRIWHSILFSTLELIDEGAFLKWKRMLAPATLTREEARFLKRFEVVRRFWPFNRKRPQRESRQHAE